MEIKDSKNNAAPEIKLFTDFELFNHLKHNLKNSAKQCEMHESEFIGYCYQCKHSICEVCTAGIHSNHNILNKADYPQSFSFFNKMFVDFESEIIKVEGIIQPTQLLKTFKEGIEFEMDDLIEKLKDLKMKRLKEVESLFVTSCYDFRQMRANLKSTKDKISKYFQKNKEFIDLTNVTDEDNFLFLQNFDIINETFISFSEYMKLIDRVKSTYSGFQNIYDPKFTKISKSIDDLLLEQKKKEIRNANEKIWDSIYSFNAPTSIDPTNNNKGKRRLSEQQSPINTNLTNNKSTDKAKPKNSSLNKSTNSVDSKTNTAPESSNLSQKLVQVFDKINEDLFFKLKEKIDLYDNFNDLFRQNVFESIKKNQSLMEINKLVKGFEEKIAKKIIISSATRKINLNKSTLRSKKFIGDYSSNNSLNSSGKNVNGARSKSPSSKQQSQFASQGKSDEKEIKKSKKLVISKVDEELVDKSSDDSEKLNIEVDMKLNNKVENNRNNMYRVVDKVFKPKIKNNNMKSINPKSREMKTPKSNIESNAHETIQTNTITNNSVQNNKYKINTELAELVQENMKVVKTIISKEKVTLTIPILRKYYSFNLIDYLRNLDSSETGLEKKDKSVFEIFDRNLQENEKYNNVVIKVLEGSDEIHIYYKNSKRLEKRKIEFDVKKFNTKVFFKGCRWCHVQGKVYICGGKDFNGDKVLFMVYNLKDNKLTRLMDMKYPRSFHTLIFHENIRALIALGGENNNSCEMYDFYLNIWNDFPEMNYPRANVSYIINDSGTMAYAMFGLVGDIVKKQLTDVIEVIDMIDMNKGWYRLEYVNNTGVDIKTKELTVNLLPNNKILLYGGNECRSPTYTYLTLDLKSLELSKLEQKQGELMKLENEKFNTIGTVEASYYKNQFTTISTVSTQRTPNNANKKDIKTPASTTNRDKNKKLIIFN